jgi:sec-independent protein translocase protein TatB
MPSFQDSAVIFLIALVLFGPKKLPELARQLGKIMGELRRASNEFKMQMEDELRLTERDDQKKRVEAIMAATPEHTIAPLDPASTHPHDQYALTEADATASPETAALPESFATSDSFATAETGQTHMETTSETEAHAAASSPTPIATAGDLEMLPPATGLPVARNSASANGSAMHPETGSAHEPDQANPSAATYDAATPSAPAASQEESSLHA